MARAHTSAISAGSGSDVSLIVSRAARAAFLLVSNSVRIRITSARSWRWQHGGLQNVLTRLRGGAGDRQRGLTLAAAESNPAIRLRSLVSRLLFVILRRPAELGFPSLRTALFVTTGVLHQFLLLKRAETNLSAEIISLFGTKFENPV